MATRSFKVMGADPTDPRAVANARAFNDNVFAEQKQLQHDRNAGWRLTKNIFKGIGLGVPLGAAMLPGGALSLAGGGGATVGHQATGAAFPGAGTFGAPVGTTATGAGMNLGRIWDIANLGIGGASSFLGMRSNNRALDRQAALQEREINMRMAADAEARAEARRQFDATQANTARQFAADDEDRRFSRSLIEQREARLEPYRQMARAKLQRLSDFLGVRF